MNLTFVFTLIIIHRDIKLTLIETVIVINRIGPRANFVNKKNGKHLS